MTADIDLDGLKEELIPEMRPDWIKETKPTDPPNKVRAAALTTALLADLWDKDLDVIFEKLAAKGYRIVDSERYAEMESDLSYWCNR